MNNYYSQTIPQVNDDVILICYYYSQIARTSNADVIHRQLILTTNTYKLIMTSFTDN